LSHTGAGSRCQGCHAQSLPLTADYRVGRHLEAVKDKNLIYPGLLKKRLLKAEGITVSDGKVDLNLFQWKVTDK